LELIEDVKEFFNGLHDDYWKRRKKELAAGNIIPLSAVANANLSAAGGLAMNLVQNRQSDKVADITRIIVNTDTHTPAVPYTNAAAYIWFFLGDASSFNVASVIDYLPVAPNGTIFPGRLSYPLNIDPILMPGEKLSMLVVGGPANANVSAFIHGQYYPKRDWMQPDA
jgi:hypothetical protein